MIKRIFQNHRRTYIKKIVKKLKNLFFIYIFIYFRIKTDAIETFLKKQTNIYVAVNEYDTRISRMILMNYV